MQSALTIPKQNVLGILNFTRYDVPFYTETNTNIAVKILDIVKVLTIASCYV